MHLGLRQKFRLYLANLSNLGKYDFFQMLIVVVVAKLL
jgi:hypothetical protein